MHLKLTKKTILYILSTAFLLMRLPGLGTDLANTDSTRWHRRSEKFLTAIKTLDFENTYQHYQPGVTLMILNSGVKQLGFWVQETYTPTPKTLENADYFPIIHGVSKATMVLVLFGLFIFILKCVDVVFGNKVSTIFGLLMVFEPYLVGIDRWFHLTSFETYFAMASFLSLLVWLKNSRKLNFYLSAVFFVLGVYSKLTALTLSPVLGMIFLYKFYSDRNSKEFVTNVTVYTLIVLVTALILFPAMWVSPSQVVYNLSNAIVSAVGDDIRGEQITGLLATFYYPVILSFKLSPITVISFLVSIYLFVRHKLYKQPNVLFVALYFFTFFSALTIADKKIDRYSIALVPILLLFISINLQYLSKNLLKTFGVFVIFFTGWLVYNYYPMYSAFYSPLFGRNPQQKALQLKVYDNSGEYYAPASMYLNTKGRDYYTYVPYNLEPFSYYNKANVQRFRDNNTNYIVTSVDHLDDVDTTNCNLDQTFGSRLYPTVYVFVCN